MYRNINESTHSSSDLSRFPVSEKQKGITVVFCVVKGHYTSPFTNEGRIYHTVDMYGNLISETWISHKRWTLQDLGIKRYSSNYDLSYRKNRHKLDQMFGENMWIAEVIDGELFQETYLRRSEIMSSPAIRAVMSRGIGYSHSITKGYSKKTCQITKLIVSER